MHYSKRVCHFINSSWKLCLDQLNCVKMAAFHIYVHSEKQKSLKGPSQESRLGGDGSHIVSGKKFPVGKGSERRCIVVMQQPVLLSPKFGSKSFHILMQSPLNVRVVSGIDCLVCQHEFYVSNPPNSKENDEHALDFVLQLSYLFRAQ
jgi:hypothetical protein